MLGKPDLLRLKALARADLGDPKNCNLFAQILASRIADQGEHDDAAGYIADLLAELIKRHSSAQDTAARQLYWGLMAAISAMGERIIDEAPNN